LTGDKEQRKQIGLEDSQTSAKGLLEIVQGERDNEVGEFVTKYGQKYEW
jgi:hypothetical protein